MTLRTSDEPRDITHSSRCLGISRGGATSRTRQSLGLGNFSPRESALTLRGYTRQSTSTTKRLSTLGGNSSLRTRFTASDRTIITGSWATQDLAGHAARFITTEARSIPAVSRRAGLAATATGTWRYGTSFSRSSTGRRTDHCHRCRTRTSTQEWGLKDSRQLFRE